MKVQKSEEADMRKQTAEIVLSEETISHLKKQYRWYSILMTAAGLFLIAPVFLPVPGELSPFMILFIFAAADCISYRTISPDEHREFCKQYHPRLAAGLILAACICIAYWDLVMRGSSSVEWIWVLLMEQMDGKGV